MDHRRSHRPGDDDQPSPADSCGAVMAGLTDVDSAVSGLLGAPMWSLTDAQAMEAVRDSFQLIQRLQAVHLSAVAELDSRPGAVPGAAPGAVARTFLVHALNRSPGQAGGDVQAGLALRPDADPAAGGLPRLGAALSAGLVSREHIRTAVSAMHRLPKKLLREPVTDEEATAWSLEPTPGDTGGRRLCRGDLVDHLITEHAKRFDSGTTARIAEYLLNAADPDGSRSFDPEATSRRGLSLVQDSTGMTVIRGELDQAGGAYLRAAIEAFSAPDPARMETAEDGTMIQVTDKRTASQRRADAMQTIARLALGSTGGSGSEARLVIHTSLDTLAEARASGPASTATATATDADDTYDVPGQTDPSGHGARLQPADTPAVEPAPPTGTCRLPRARAVEPWAEFGLGGLVHPATLARLSCDAILQKVILSPGGAVLDLGRDVRTVTTAQRKALVARDRGCTIPGCHAPAAWCDAHHVTWWRHGGRTDITNLALVCQRHHSAIHQGIWTLQVRDGVPWALPPHWVDPLRRPLRNTYHQATSQAHHLGTQLRLNLDGNSADPIPAAPPRPPAGPPPASPGPPGP